jgi:hypothetical protein
MIQLWCSREGRRDDVRLAQTAVSSPAPKARNSTPNAGAAAKAACEGKSIQAGFRCSPGHSTSPQVTALSPMTFRRRRERAVAAKIEIPAARERLRAALRSMDYARALDCQLEVERLESLARWLDNVVGNEPWPTKDKID